DLHGLDGHARGLEPALVERPAGPELRLQPELVGVEAADAVLGGDALGALELRRELVVGRVAAVHGLAVAGGGPVHSVGAEWDRAHVLDTTSQRDVLGAGAHQAHREVERLLGRATGAVDGREGDRLRQPGGEPGVAGDVAGLGADLVDAATDDLTDAAWIDAGAIEHRGLDRPQHVEGGGAGQRAVLAADRGAGGLDDHDLAHRVLLLRGSAIPYTLFQRIRGSRGRPRMRSPIWLRLISDVPPAIDHARGMRTSRPDSAPGPSKKAPSGPVSSARIAAASCPFSDSTSLV